MSGMAEGKLLARVNDERKEDDLGEEVVFRLGTDSWAWPQNDNVSENELRDGRILLRGIAGVGYE